MKNIFKIFKKDMKNIFTNWVATVVVIALMAIPSLYALVNIEAAWDPYGNTSGIKVAVVNEDKGTVFKEQDINVGNELIDKLKDNDKIGWTFLDKDEAENGVLMEEYYAVIEVPEDFSEDVTTLVKKDVTKPKLKYIVNEKTNAVAPKMTDSAVKTVKQQLDDNITKAVTGIIFRALDEIGIDIQDNRSYLRNIMDKTYELDENMPEYEQILNATIDGTMSISDFLEKTNEIIPNVNDIVDSTDSFLNQSVENLDSAKDEFNELSPFVTQELNDSQNKLLEVNTDLQNLEENIIPETSKKTLLTVSDSLIAMKNSNNKIRTKLNKAKKFIKKVNEIKISKPNIEETEENADALEKINDAYDKQIKALEEVQEALKTTNEDIDKLLERIDTIDEKLELAYKKTQEEIQKVESGQEFDSTYLSDTRKITEDISSLCSSFIDNYNAESINAINDNFDSIKDICMSSLELLNQSRDIIPDVQELINTFTNIDNTSSEKLKDLKEKLPDIKNNVHKLAEKFKEIDNDEDIDEVLDLITNDWKEQSNFLSSPIEISDNRLYPIPNYGTAATPFYIMLCLWIGGYMLSILLNTEIDTNDEEFKNVKTYEIYFGKMLLFLFIGVFQAVIATLGALFLLKIYCVHKVMFVLFSIFVGVVFMVMIYTAVSLFNHGGIVFGIVLLVMQVAGTSSNFPIEVNPEIFQVIFPYLPFTYAISGIRQIIAGIVYSILLKDIYILSAFLVGSIVLGLTLKKRSNIWLKNFTQKIKESNLIAG